MAYFNGNKDFLIALKGESSKWYSGTGIMGDGTTNSPVNSANSGITLAKMYDMYLNTQTYNVYACLHGGTWNEAKWMYLCNIKGGRGDNGESTQWYTGKHYTNGSSGALIGSSTYPFETANVGDMYLNEDTGDVYRCTKGGNFLESIWYRRANITGPQGEQGGQGGQGEQGIPGEKGDNGTSAQWYTGIHYTENNSGVLMGPGFDAFDYANVGDMYLNEETGDVYRCIAAGGPVEAYWLRVTNIKGKSAELTTQFDDDADGKAADAGAVRDALIEKVDKDVFNTLKDVVNSMIYPVEDPVIMDGILSEDREKVKDKIYMFVGPTTTVNGFTYRTGGIYKVTEEEVGSQ